MPLFSRDRISYITKADLARAAGDWNVAAGHYAEALTHNPERPDIWVQYGHALKESGRRLDAEAAYRRAIEGNPASADAHLQLAHLLKLQGRDEEAKPAYLRALALAPELADARRALAELGLDDSQIAEARAALTPLPPRSRRRPSRITLADRARELGQWAEAARLYRQALDRNPRNAPIWVQYGHMVRHLGDVPAAEAAYRRALACDPKSADTYLQLGHVLKDQGKTEEAQSAYLRAFVLEPTLSEALPELRRLEWDDAEVTELERLRHDEDSFCHDNGAPPPPEALPELRRLEWDDAEVTELERLRNDEDSFCHDNGAPSPLLPVTISAPAATPDLSALRSLEPRGRIAVVVHLYYPELWPELRDAVARIWEPFDIFVSVVRGASEHTKQDIIEAFPHARVFEFENRGRDLGPFIMLVNSGVLFKYDLICKVHSKRSPHEPDGDDWRRTLIEGVLGNSQQIKEIIDAFSCDPDLGMVVADGCIYKGDDRWQGNHLYLEEILPKIGISTHLFERTFPGGSIFWTRSFLLRTIAGLGITLHDFEPEPLPVNGTFTHAVERLFGLICEDAGMRFAEASRLLRTPSLQSSAPSEVSIVALYLPQFHPVPENDKWWGKGFTEWTNVASARPWFEGHRQPRLPADLGFYDLRLPEAREGQAELAKAYGVSAFCYYYYWFNGRRILERPLNETLESGRPDFPFLICWANEPWTRNWDGKNVDILLPQDYEPGWPVRFARDVLPLLRDPRYFRLDGRPVLLIYRVTHIPQCRSAIEELRAELRQAGVPEVHVAAAWVSFIEDDELDEDPAALGLDAYFEFPPHRLIASKLVPKFTRDHEEFSGNIYDYGKIVSDVLNNLNHDSNIPRHRGVMMGWDNTARRKYNPDMFFGATPTNFRRWLRGTIAHERRAGGERVVFVNAWNEWAEGTYLEPDRDFGLGWLEAVASARATGAASESRFGDDVFRLVYVSSEPDWPSHLYRVTLPMAAARPYADVSWMAVADVPSRLSELEFADAVVFWRTIWSDNVAAGIEAARGGGASILFDIDDLLIVPSLAHENIIDSIRTQGLTEDGMRLYCERMRQTCEAADVCLATTEELARHLCETGKPAWVLPNGFDQEVLTRSRLAARGRRLAAAEQGVIRIGYAGGSPTHQRDFRLCAAAIADVLRTYPETRLVVFRSMLNVDEFPELLGLGDSIEWRDFVPLERVPEELARFDINLAPLEVENPFCEAKSELKYFEAAIVGVATVASPTGPFSRAIRNGETGFLAGSSCEWRRILAMLVEDSKLRNEIAAAAYRDVLWTFGPERRRAAMRSLIEALRRGGPRPTMVMSSLTRERAQGAPAIARVPDTETLFDNDRLRPSEVTVCVQIRRNLDSLRDTLEAIKVQTLADLDLVVVADSSMDKDVGAAALEWARDNAVRFNRIVLVRAREDLRDDQVVNLAFDTAETEYVLLFGSNLHPLPECAAECLDAVQRTGAAFAYVIADSTFVDSDGRPAAFQERAPSDDAVGTRELILLSKAAWSGAGGYDRIHASGNASGFWCRLAGLGLCGVAIGTRPYVIAA